jgi:hypothetical protein
MNARAIYRSADRGPHFSDIGIFDDCNVNGNSFSWDFGSTYENDTGQDGTTFFKVFETV